LDAGTLKGLLILGTWVVCDVVNQGQSERYCKENHYAEGIEFDGLIEAMIELLDSV
jgi:hypothetical protein